MASAARPTLLLQDLPVLEHGSLRFSASMIGRQLTLSLLKPKKPERSRREGILRFYTGAKSAAHLSHLLHPTSGPMNGPVSSPGPCVMLVKLKRRQAVGFVRRRLKVV
jgi:hypothetical protein